MAPVRAWRFRAPAFLALLGLAAWQQNERVSARETLELTYLANEGFLIRFGEEKLLIDAFVPQPYSGYAAVPPEMHADMLAGKPPFDGVDLALASHVHLDHFQPASAAPFLAAHSETRFISAPQVLEKLSEELPESSPAFERLRELLPEPRKTEEAREGDIHVLLLRLPHSGGGRNLGIQNLGHLIDLGGARLLHLGDAEANAAELVGYDLPSRSIDVALVPYWWLGDAEGIRQARKALGARHLVAVHVPPGEVEAVRTNLSKLDGEVLVFERAGEVRKLALGPRYPLARRFVPWAALPAGGFRGTRKKQARPATRCFSVCPLTIPPSAKIWWSKASKPLATP